ncbi:DUF1778 domain-containing protein [Mesorhizobium sp. M7A.F.Ca.US.010.02.1.1]|nr:DUF1778 domain-containing protein [Mesorhizobium sp. M7A.F.Ca.US.010.02.1.1]
MPRSTDSMTEHEAQPAIDAAEVVRVSATDFVRILDLLERPPKPNAKLRKVIAALPNTL